MRFLIALMLLWTTAVYADHNGIQPDEKQLPIYCGDTEHLIEGLNEKFNEEVVMMAAGMNSADHDIFHSLWINNDTGTWSFVVLNKDMGVTCVIASGSNVKMFFPGRGI